MRMIPRANRSGSGAGSLDRATLSFLCQFIQISECLGRLRSDRAERLPIAFSRSRLAP